MKYAALWLFLAVTAFSQSKPGDEEIVWLDNYKDALKEARATGKPIFLEYRCEP